MASTHSISTSDFIARANSGQPIEDADLGSIDWDDQELPDLHLKDCIATNVEFENVILEGLKAERCQFIDCTFKSCDLKDAEFLDCGFVNKSEYSGPYWRFCNIERGRFKGCDVSFSRFERCGLYDMAIEKCLFPAVDFSSSRFCRELSKTKRLTSLILKTSNFSQSNWHGLELETINADQVDFTEALMAECNLKSAVLTECNLTNAELLNADLTGANLSSSNLQGLDLRTLKSHSGLIILEAQQRQLLEELGVEVL